MSIQSARGTPEKLLQHVESTVVRGDPESVIAEIDRYSSENWMMHVGPKKGKVLDDQIKKTAPNLVLEFGSYCGYSAVRIARLLPENAKLICIEFDPVNTAIVTRVLHLAGLLDKVEVISGAVHETLPRLKTEFGVSPKSVDLVFIDHEKSRYLEDLKVLESLDLLHAGSVLVADNVIYPGAPDYLKYVESCGKYETRRVMSTIEYSDIEDGIEISIYKGNQAGEASTAAGQ